MPTIVRIAAFCVALLFAGAIHQQAASSAYPDRTVKIIVPFPPGGPTDVIARLIGHKLAEKFGQQFIVENQGGAAGNLGMAAAAKTPGDGYTILFVSSSYVVNPSLYAKVPYDPDKDFIPITKAGAAPHALLVHPSIPAKSVQELVDLIKATPGKYTIASPGLGTTPSLSIELFKQTFGLNDLVVVPIKGQEAETMQGILVPAGTPKAIAALLEREITAIIAAPDVQAKMLAIGIEPEGITSEAFAAYIKAEIAKWKKVIADAKIGQI